MYICNGVRFTKEMYVNWLNNVITANKTNDFEWFHDHSNRYRCKMLIKFWNSRYNVTSDVKYKNAKNKLKHIIKMAENKEKWKQYLREK